MSLTVFVIFHDIIDKRNYEMLDPEEFDMIRFVCVNENIKKTFDKDFFDESKFIYEWKLPSYDPNLQRLHVCDETMVPKSHFNETGVHWHLTLNKVCKTEYIYVCHNDMIFTKGSLKRVKDLLAPHRGITIARADYEKLVATSTYGKYDSSMYTYAKRELEITDSQKLFPMFTNCAMKTCLFEQQMHKLIVINKKLFMATLPGEWYRPAITFERTWALAMGAVLDEIVVVNGILHCHPPIDDILEKTRNGELTQYPEFS